MNFSILISKVYTKFLALHWCVSVITAMTAVVFYPRLPQIVPTHFGYGVAGSPGGKLTIFIMPIMLIVLGLISMPKWIDQRYADYTIQNTAVKIFLIAIMAIVWVAVGTAFFTYYRLAW
ncbi:DUF1648 domain-containing protein [Lentilactobacillus parakefiri]|uniref:DUF1648 domain-containing protein n=1 Tax=Lentilactobacillus parakefiri TaxID=152332 RepID=A0A269YFM7_9LACO|nr:DUF1648 domain-containing protein [Lentilactobacillus parakefiri]PAK84344.1 hypothetical protein B8W98_05280 [Lentilactobacillus parakefiri]